MLGIGVRRISVTTDTASAIVLAGGRGSRIGTPKFRLQFAGATLVERALSRLAGVTSDIVVVLGSQDDKITLPLSATVVVDESPGQGPLMGLLTGLRASSADRSVVVACDMPFLSAALLTHLVGLSPGFDAVVPSLAGRAQYLHAVYRRTCIPVISRMMEDGEFTVAGLTDRVLTRFVEEAEWRSLDPEARSFVNVNTADDLRWAEEVEAGSRAAHGSRAPRPPKPVKETGR